jgi:signal transduction histidine kinase
MTTGDRSHSATETAEAERETHQSKGIGARHWPKLVRAHQSKEPQNQNWIAKASGALSRRLHSSKVLIISVNMVLVIILLLFNAATLYKWPALIETLHQNDPDYTADQIFHTLIPKLAQMETWRDHNAQLKAHTDQIYAQVNGQITLFSIRGEILAQTSLHPDPGSHNDPQTHYISQQSFAAIQPDAQATSHFVSLEQLLSAAIHKTLQNAYRHADFNIRSNIGNLYFLETGIIKHKDKILGALAIFIEDSARQKIYSDLRIQSVAAVGLGILVSVLISLLIFYRVSHPITVLTRRLQQKNAQTSLPSPELMLEQAPKAPEGSEVANLTAVLREMSRKYYHQIDMQNRFTSDVIHEVKNPLTSLRAAAKALELVKEETQRQQLLGIIQEDVLRMERLLNDIGAAGRLDGQLEQETCASFDIGQLLRNVAQRYDPVAAEKDITIELELPQKTIIINGLEKRLAQVFENLATNAISFCDAGGIIRIWVKLQTDTCLAVIEDTGPGFPKGSLDKIFNRFYSDRPNSAFGEHSGLGLSISKQVVEAHGGVIWAENITSKLSTGEESDILGARLLVALPRICSATTNYMGIT